MDIKTPLLQKLEKPQYVLLLTSCVILDPDSDLAVWRFFATEPAKRLLGSHPDRYTPLIPSKGMAADGEERS